MARLKFGSTGRKLYDETVEAYELAEHERVLLVQACQTADAIALLQAALDRDGPLNKSPQGVRVHPSLPELRQQRVTFARLCAALGLESGVQDDAQPARPVRGVYSIKGTGTA